MIQRPSRTSRLMTIARPDWRAASPNCLQTLAWRGVRCKSWATRICLYAESVKYLSTLGFPSPIAIDPERVGEPAPGRAIVPLQGTVDFWWRLPRVRRYASNPGLRYLTLSAYFEAATHCLAARSKFRAIRGRGSSRGRQSPDWRGVACQSGNWRYRRRPMSPFAPRLCRNQCGIGLQACA